MLEKQKLCVCCKKVRISDDKDVCDICTENARVQFGAGFGIPGPEEVFLSEEIFSSIRAKNDKEKEDENNDRIYST